MTRFLQLFIFFLFLSLNGFSQKSNYPFVLEGKIRLDSGLIILIPLDGDGSQYYPNNSNFEAKINKGEFIITGEIPYPLAYNLFVKVNSQLIDISDVIYLDIGKQYINYDIDKLRSPQMVSNTTMKEFNDFYLPKNNDNNDSTLFNYCKSYPDSYISLWQLVYSLQKDGYNSIKEDIYNNLSKHLKETVTGRKIKEKLTSAKLVEIGNKFPTLSLFNSTLNETPLNIDKNYHSKIVLIDFWFSHCTPCISQFPELIRLYNIYHSKGFEIIGISVDDKPLVNDWITVIENYKLPWKQYLDLKAIESHKLSIASYPNNFLLDQQGKIIYKKIDIKELANYLKDRLQ
jgi:thiol-disulfide isomerase/thioredoxin